MKIFVAIPINHPYKILSYIIEDAAKSINAEIERFDRIGYSEIPKSTIIESISKSDVVVADVSEGNPNVMFEFGIARALGKPTILMCANTEKIPYEMVHGSAILVYEELKPERVASMLARELLQANKAPGKFEKEEEENISKKNSVFISYNHKDHVYLSRLKVHLKPLEKSGQLNIWEDTKLRAGDEWKKEIESALNRATIGILLISADFMASDFIVDNELPPLLSKAQTVGTRIIPIIVTPSRFDREENLNKFQAINSPSEPLINLPFGKQEEYFDKVAREVEIAIRPAKKK